MTKKANSKEAQVQQGVENNMKQKSARSYYDVEQYIDPGIHFDGRHLEDGSKEKIEYLQANNLTNQADAEGCDINKLLKNNHDDVTRLIALQKANPVYGEFDSMMDFGAAQEVIAKAKEQFEALGAKIRNRFNNDPGLFLDFMNKSDKDSLEEQYKLGLAVRPMTPEDKKAQQEELDKEQKVPLK